MIKDLSKTILIVSPAVPKPDCNAGDRRFFAILKLLVKYCSVNIWIASGIGNDSESLQYMRDISELKIEVLSVTQNINQILVEKYYDAIFFEFYVMAEIFIKTCRQYQPHAQIIVDSVDVSFARELIAAELGLIEKKQAEETKEKELKIYGKVDAVIAASELDCHILHAEKQNLNIFVVPIIIPIQQQSLNPLSKELVFIGGFNWSPNLDGIQWFIKEIWTAISDRVPDATVTVIGSHPTDEVIRLGETLGVNVIGYVPDTNPYLKRSAISIAPLRYGGGMKGKVIEAMSLGLPVVTTSVGAQGLNAISGKHLIIADEPSEFAEAVISLLVNPSTRTEVGLSGQQLTADLCSPEVVEKVIQDMLDSLIPQEQSSRPLLPRARFALLAFLLRDLGLLSLWELAKKMRRRVISLVSNQQNAC